MDLFLKTRTVEDIVVIDLAGRLSRIEPVQVLHDFVDECIQAGNRKFVINLGGVSYIDSAGLGEIVTTHVALRNCGGSLKLLNLSKRIRDLLHVARLQTLFETFDDEVQALQAF